MTFFEYFDRVYVISLPGRTDRRHRVTRELARVGLPMTPGKVELFDAIRTPSADGFRSAGSRGCFLSHREVLGLCLGRRRVIILEDDVVFRPDFTELEAAAVTRLDRDPGWGLVHFGYQTSKPVVGSGLVRHEGCTQSLIGSHFYAVNGPVISRLKDWFDETLVRPAGHPDGGRTGADGTLNHFRWANEDVPIYLHAPLLGQQYNSQSSIARRRWFDVPVVGAVTRKVREYLYPARWD